jgi:hypothetical protein
VCKDAVARFDLNQIKRGAADHRKRRMIRPGVSDKDDVKPRSAIALTYIKADRSFMY